MSAIDQASWSGADFVATYEHSYLGRVFEIASPASTDVIREIERLVDLGMKHVALGFDDFDGICRSSARSSQRHAIEDPVAGAARALGRRW